jgi:hypothetical protein
MTDDHYIHQLRAVGPGFRLSLALLMSSITRYHAWQETMRLYPGADDIELRFRLCESTYGLELALRFRSHLLARKEPRLPISDMLDGMQASIVAGVESMRQCAGEFGVSDLMEDSLQEVGYPGLLQHPIA